MRAITIKETVYNYKIGKKYLVIRNLSNNNRFLALKESIGHTYKNCELGCGEDCPYATVKHCITPKDIRDLIEKKFSEH